MFRAFEKAIAWFQGPFQCFFGGKGLACGGFGSFGGLWRLGRFGKILKDFQ